MNYALCCCADTTVQVSISIAIPLAPDCSRRYSKIMLPEKQELQYMNTKST